MSLPYGLIAMGRVSVDLYPEQSGPLARVETFAKSLGGTATNVAVAAARLGHRVALVTKVGDDPLGEYVREALDEFDVDDRFVGTDAELKTPVVIAELDPPDDPRLLFYREPKAPDMNLDVDDVDPLAVAECGVFWVTGTGLSDEPSLSATAAALKHRRRRHATVLDLDWRPMLWKQPELAPERYAEALPQVTVAVGNRAEVEVAVGTSDPDEAATRLLDAGVQLAIVKLGADGVLVATADHAEVVPGIRVPVVCGLGAGDAFGGALCHGLLEEWDPVKTVRYANAAGAIVASRLACADAMPTLDEIEELLEESHVA